MVAHAVEEHGGMVPSMLAVIDRIEPSPLYRAARESVVIARLGSGPSNLNRCQEWGAPRVPVITVRGGEADEDGSKELTSGAMNDRKEWTKETLARIETGGMKRVKLELDESSHIGPLNCRATKKRRIMKDV